MTIMHISTIGKLKKYLLFFIFLMNGIGMVFAQDTVATEQPVKKQLAKAPFESGYFIADRTVTLPPARTLEFVIQHDFGTIQNHFSDIFGIWGASNIRLGFNYTLNKNVAIGFGTTKNKMIQDLSVKYTFLRQQKGGIPVTMAVYGNMAISAAKGWDKYTGAKFSGGDTSYSIINRLCYYGELMIARRFCKEFSAQVSIGWVHYNIVDSATMSYNHYKGKSRNNNLNISGIGRIKVSPQTSILLSYSQPVLTYLNTAPWPNFGVGVEISTSTHAFQIFLSSAQGLIPQETVMYNNNNPYNGAILLGFNITRLWTF
jgi:hypothetical protein